MPDIWAVLSEVRKGEFPDPPETDEPATEIETGAVKPLISGEIDTIPELMDAESGIKNVIVSELVPSKLKDVLLEFVSIEVIIDCQPKCPKPEPEESLDGNDQSSDPSLRTSIIGSEMQDLRMLLLPSKRLSSHLWASSRIGSILFLDWGIE